jgi:hypothetical protein
MNLPPEEWQKKLKNVTILTLLGLPGHRLLCPHQPGRYQEVLNSDSAHYGGGNLGNSDRILLAEDRPWMNRPWSLELTLPPLGVLVLEKDLCVLWRVPDLRQSTDSIAAQSRVPGL